MFLIFVAAVTMLIALTIYSKFSNNILKYHIILKKVFVFVYRCHKFDSVCQIFI